MVMKIETPTAKQYRLHKNYYPKMGLKKIEGRLYNIYNLPDNLTVSSDLDLRDNKLTSLPKGLKVGGYLNLAFNKLTSLPEGLEVEGSLTLWGNDLTSLPKDLKVGGYLDLWSNKLTSLPKGLKVGGYLNLSRNNFPKGYKLPDTVKIGENVMGYENRNFNSGKIQVT